MNTRGAPGAVVFDFGGVLITTIANQIGKIAASHGVEASVMHEVLLGPRASGDSHPWHRAERGELALADIQSELAPWADQHEMPLHGDEIDRLLAAGEYVVVTEMVNRVRSLRADGFLTGLLTNTFAEFQPTMQRDLDFELFDAVVESFAVGARKPEPAIYEEIESQLAVSGPEIVYLDDFDQNLVPADERGWHTILVRDPSAALSELDKLVERPTFGI
ncbi:MAG: HAD family hydrolase [Ilumatobacter sp.]